MANAWGLSPFEEDVRGVIIGGDTSPYEFWTEGPTFYCDHAHRIAKGHFGSDAEALAWFKANYPDYYAQGAEMRVF